MHHLERWEMGPTGHKVFIAERDTTETDRFQPRELLFWGAVQKGTLAKAPQPNRRLSQQTSKRPESSLVDAISKAEG